MLGNGIVPGTKGGQHLCPHGPYSLMKEVDMKWITQKRNVVEYRWCSVLERKRDLLKVARYVRWEWGKAGKMSLKSDI